MKTLPELQGERSHQVRTAEDILARAEKAGRNPNAEERQLIDGCFAEVEKIDEEIKAIQDADARRNKLNCLLDTINKPEDRQIPGDQPDDKPKPQRIEVKGFQARYGKLKAFKGETSRDAELKAYTSGQWIRASLFNDFRAQRWCETHGVAFRAALSEGTNTAGGYLVPDEMAQAIIDLREEYGVFRKEARITAMGRDHMIIPRRTAGVSAVFVGENSSLTESDLTWDNVTLTAKKLGVMTRMSTEVADDAIINLADQLASEFAYAFALKEDQCGFIGDGTSTYGGIFGIQKLFDTNYASLAGAVFGSAGTSGGTHDLFSEIDNADLTTVMAALPMYARAGAKWYCSAVANDIVFSRLKATAGGNTTQTLDGKLVDSYLGYPIVVSQVLNATTTANDNKCMLMFGDLSKAADLGDRRGIEVKRSDDRYFDTDQIAIKATERIDINVHEMGTSSVAGPVVALMGTTS